MPVKTEYDLEPFVEKLVEVLNRDFDLVFEKGFVRAKIGVRGDSLCIYVGKRDIQVGFDGTFLGAGTRLDSDIPVQDLSIFDGLEEETQG